MSFEIIETGVSFGISPLTKHNSLPYSTTENSTQIYDDTNAFGPSKLYELYFFMEGSGGTIDTAATKLKILRCGQTAAVEENVTYAQLAGRQMKLIVTNADIIYLYAKASSGSGQLRYSVIFRELR